MTVHNRKEMTLLCLSKLYQSIITQDCSLTVYLTDDGCTDGTIESIEKQFPDVIILHGNGNLFWNRGMYLAWNKAIINSYDLYLWLNDDTYIFDDALDRLVECSSHYYNQIVVGSTCSSIDLNDITYGGILQHKGLIRDLSTPIECDTFNGNIVLIPRSVYERVGINDPIFHHSLGDFDYGLRAKKIGIKSIVSSGIYGRCDLHKNISVWCDPSIPFKIRWNAFFKPTEANPFELFIYKKRHFGLVSACLTIVSNFVHVLFPDIWCKFLK